MTALITINITAEERNELLNALYFYTATLERTLTQQEIGRANYLLNMLESTED